MASISADRFYPSSRRQGHNKYSRRVMHMSGVELVVVTNSGSGQMPLRYYRVGKRTLDSGKKGRSKKILFALWLAMHRKGIHLG